MSPAELGLIGGIAGIVIGLIGGIVGTYFSIRNAKGEKERAFIMRTASLLWLIIIVMAVTAYLIPSPYKVFAFSPVWFILPFIIIYLNKKQRELRKSERND